MAAKSVTVLPNLLLSTTYALNKSYTKRAIVGLELDENADTFRPVIKLSGGGPPSKYVTFDVNAWEAILDQMDTIKSYLSDGYNVCYEDFGEPSQLILSDHTVTFTTSYEDKAISIVERPPSSVNINAPAPVAADEAPAASDNEATFATVASSSKTIVNIDENARAAEEALSTSTTPVAATLDSPVPQPRRLFDTPQPSTKKRKVDYAPGIVLQLPTFEGLRLASESITLNLRKLEVMAAFINYAYEYITDYLKLKLNDEDEEGQMRTLRYPPKFFGFYNTYRHAMEIDIGNKAQTMMIDTSDVNIALAEIKAFFIPYIAKNLIASLQMK